MTLYFLDEGYRTEIVHSQASQLPGGLCTAGLLTSGVCFAGRMVHNYNNNKLFFLILEPSVINL